MSSAPIASVPAEEAFSAAWVTVPNDEAVQKVVNALLTDKLAACVNVIPKVQSYYWWEGKIQSDSELLLMIKTKTSLLPDVISKVRSVHPYKVPEVISAQLGPGNPDYLAWIASSTK